MSKKPFNPTHICTAGDKCCGLSENFWMNFRPVMACCAPEAMKCSYRKEINDDVALGICTTVPIDEKVRAEFLKKHPEAERHIDECELSMRLGNWFKGKTEDMPDDLKDSITELRNQSIKADAGKPRMELIPPEALEAIAEVRTYGTNKYGDAECWKEVTLERYMGATLRHLTAVMKNPTSVDPESGLLHINHALCNVAFMAAIVSQMPKDVDAICQENSDSTK